MRALKNLLIAFVLFCTLFASNVSAADENTQTPQEGSTQIKELKHIYIANVADALPLSSYSYYDLSNRQLLTLEITNGDKIGTRIDTNLIFPNPQFKAPLKVGDKVLIGTGDDITNGQDIKILSHYRQNNLLIWAFILMGLFMIISGFKANIKYFQIFIITLISGAIVLFFYHRNTYITFIGLFLWQICATIWFAFRIFKKRIPALVLSMSVIANELLAMLLIFIMKSINIFDTGFFELFSNSITDARKVMIYIFALIVVYPITVVFAEQIVSEAIKKKREENDILRIALIRHVSKYTLKTLNNIFLTFFGLFFAIFISVVAIASSENLSLQVLNSSSLSQILSAGFLILFSLLVFIPLVSFVTGMWLGKYESHELVTDQNLRQLELQ